MRICPDLCSICNEKYYARGYCRIHYERFKRWGDPLIVKHYTVNKTKCGIKGCEKKWFARNHCQRHYNQIPEILKRNRERAKKYQNEHPDSAFQRWKKYITKLGDIFKLTPDQYKHSLISWSQAVRKRDNYTCQICGSKKDVEAHHILHKNKYPQLSLNINNGITLCRKRCHLEAHDRLKIEFHTVI